MPKFRMTDGSGKIYVASQSIEQAKIIAERIDSEERDRQIKRHAELIAEAASWKDKPKDKPKKKITKKKIKGVS